MNRQGRMAVRSVNKTIMDVFEVTGFAEILMIEGRAANGMQR